MVRHAIVSSPDPHRSSTQKVARMLGQFEVCGKEVIRIAMVMEGVQRTINERVNAWVIRHSMYVLQ